MNQQPDTPTSQLLLYIGTLSGAFAGFLVFSKLVGTNWPGYWLPLAGTVMVVAFACYWWLIRLYGQQPLLAMRAILTIAAGSIALSSGYHLYGYLLIPADILSFAESPFVNEIIKAKLGLPAFLDPLDNNSMPYTPGAPLLTYAIAEMLGYEDSIPAFRFIQISYVILAVFVGTHFCHLLALQNLKRDEYTQRPLWIVLWFAILFLVAVEENINRYTITLHNDGIALLVTMAGFWLIARDSMSRSLPVTIAMIFLPAIGFMCKQNLLMWLGLFVIYRFLSSHYSWKEQVFQFAATIATILLLVGGLYLLWGEYFVQWVFVSLGIKEISILRIVLHLFTAGFYIAMGLAATWVFLLRRPASRPFFPIWAVWTAMLFIELYTSGVAWPPTHLGPGIMSATSLFLVALVRLWPTWTPSTSSSLYYVRESVIGLAMISILGTMGHVRAPLNPVPAGVMQQITAIENEFQGMDPARVLMDDGSWIYLRENIVMRDRSTPVAIRVGKNQSEISHDLLAATHERLNNREYDKIIARHLGGDEWTTWWDFQDRGSGIKDVILENYREVRRIPAVEGIKNRFWMRGLTGEVRVFLPKQP